MADEFISSDYFIVLETPPPFGASSVRMFSGSVCAAKNPAVNSEIGTVAGALPSQSKKLTRHPQTNFHLDAMHILLTGTAGNVGRYMLPYLVERGHTITALDVIAVPEEVLSKIPENSNHLVNHLVFDLTDYEALDRLFDGAKARADPINAVIHLAGVPKPMTYDQRYVHNNNVVCAYNIMRTAADHGVKRIVQASSMNAMGMTFTPEGHAHWDYLPFDEESPKRPEDSYSLGKLICEAQADSLCRLFPDIRIASLRFHMIRPSYDTAWPDARWQDFWCWNSLEDCATSSLLGLTTEGWHGHEVFYIIADEICWEGGLDQIQKPTREQGCRPQSEKVGSLDLLKTAWAGRYKSVNEEFWKDNPRRSFFDCSKAERVLGWKHSV